jgi:diaminohydroxyphosphoribosylaminopyrimidine deaminase/5-amino-6-(5-phosphoribosylamino)uracil reductase
MVSAYYLNEALKEAQKADPKEVRPNPLVGAIVVDENHVIVGRGYHKKVGTPHAEVHAIADAEKNGTDLSKCTIFVTLEPCSHHGRTPPCTDLILAKGIKKVVIGSFDPNPLVSGVELLRSKGVEVELNIIKEIEELNRVFFVNQREQRPYFQFKLAVTSNGIYGHQQRGRFWISGPSAGEYVHQELRNNADAILSTARSVIHDDAKLNIRLRVGELEKTTILLDQQLSLLQSEYAHLNILAERKHSKLILVTTEQHSIRSLPAYIEILEVPVSKENKISLSALAVELYKRGFSKVLVEAGVTLFNSMRSAQFIDEFQLLVADRTLEPDPSYSYFQQLNRWLNNAEQFGFALQQKQPLGQDMLYQFCSLVRNRT